MNTVINFIKKYRIPIIFFIFFLFVFIQHQFLWLYFDDYGYASLSYAYKVNGVNGLNYGLSEIFKFLGGHYNVWGGRILFYGFEISLLKLGLPFYRLFQSLAITSIFVYSYLIISKYIKEERNKTLLALLMVLLYGTFSIATISTGIFWISASISYLIPFAFFLPFIYYLDKYHNHTFTKKLIKILSFIGLALMIFISSFSQEQVASVVLSYIVLYTVYDIWKNKKVNKDNIILCIVSLIGFLIMMLAPGNSARMDENSGFYSLSLIDKMFNNFPQLLTINFSSIHNGFFAMIFFLVQLYVCYVNNNSNKNIISKLALLSSFVIISISLFSGSFYFDYMTKYFNNNVIRKMLIIIMIIQVLLIIYSYILYFLKHKQITQIFILISAYASQAILLYSPTLPNRCSIPFMVLSFITFGTVFINILNKETKNYKFGIYIVLILSIMSISNYYTITKGYYNNSSINKYNDKALKRYSKKIKNGDKVKKIKLKRLKDDKYTSTQPYMEGSEFISYWIKEYYDIPEKVELIYK